MTKRNPIPRIGGDYDGIPYELLDGQKPPLYLEYMMYDGTWLGMSEPAYYQLVTTVRWDEKITFKYVQEYVYVGRKPLPKEGVV
jgi:hypothetical protein